MYGSVILLLLEISNFQENPLRMPIYTGNYVNSSYSDFTYVSE